MILSHEHQFIFIKTTKTAGTSTEIALSQYCGPSDIITPISPDDEKIRMALGHRGPQHFNDPPEHGDDAERVEGKHRKSRFYNHMSAAEIRRQVGRPIFDRYYKFGIERNPCDRFLSFYYWYNKTEPRPAIADFLCEENLAKLKRKGSGLYTIGGEVVVDTIVRYETLEADLQRVASDLNLPGPLHLPRAKSQFRLDRRSYQEVLTPEQIEYIEGYFAEEVETVAVSSIGNGLIRKFVAYCRETPFAVLGRRYFHPICERVLRSAKPLAAASHD